MEIVKCAVLEQIAPLSTNVINSRGGPQIWLAPTWSFRRWANALQLYFSAIQNFQVLHFSYVLQISIISINYIIRIFNAYIYKGGSWFSLKRNPQQLFYASMRCSFVLKKSQRLSCMGPVHQLVFAIHMALSFFLKFLLNKCSWQCTSLQFLKFSITWPRFDPGV